MKKQVEKEFYAYILGLLFIISSFSIPITININRLYFTYSVLITILSFCILLLIFILDYTEESKVINH